MGAKDDGGEVRKLRRYTPEERREAVEAFHKSGLTQKAFARQWGLSPVTLQNWVAKYAREGPKGLERLAEGPAKRRGKPPLAEPVKAEIAATKRRFPTFGLRKIRDFLQRFSGLRVSTGSVKKVLKEEGLPPAQPMKRRRRRKAVGPPQRFERAHPNDLWQSDITYVDVPWSRKPLYLVAFLDDRSRYVVAHGLHVHQRGEIVLEALAEGIARYGKPREVLTDQGRQYYAWRGRTEFQERLKADGIQHVVARAQHPETVGKCERLWQTLQTELWGRVMPKDLEDARTRLQRFLEHYNFQRPHRGLAGLTPADCYFGAQRAVREAIERTVAENALRLALGEMPRKPVYLVGQIDGQVVSVHGEGGRVTTVRARGVVPKYVRDREDCIRAYLAHASARRLKDLTLVSASAFIEEVTGRGLAARSVNSRVRALKQWGRWLAATRRVQFDPFAALRSLNEEEDRRHVRRALTPDEAQRLVEAARTRPLCQAEEERIHAGVTDAERARLTRLGETRALVYLLAMGTGLRMGEIRRLRWCDVAAGAVTVLAASAKSRRDQSVPLPQRLSAALDAYRPADALPTAPVVPPRGMPNTITFDRDLAAAGIAKRDAEDRIVDRHALRTTYISWLAASGAHPRTAQALARHADIQTTMARYTDLRMLDHTAAIERLPLPGGAERTRPATDIGTRTSLGTTRRA